MQNTAKHKINFRKTTLPFGSVVFLFIFVLSKTQTMNKANLVEHLCSIRANWTKVDFEEAYSDEWDSIPEKLSDCHEKMSEYLLHTYSVSFLEECIENEK